MKNRFLFDPSKFPRRKLLTLPTGFDYPNYPSLAARQMWYYVLNIGEAKWPHGFEFGHPQNFAEVRETEGFLLHFVIEGELTHRLRGETFVARSGEAALLNLAEPVTYRNELRRTAHFFWALLNGRGLSQAFAEMQADSRPIFTGLNARRVTVILRELTAVNAAEPPWHEAKASALIGDLLAELFIARVPRQSVPTRTIVGNASPAVRQTLEYIARHYYRPISLKELSARANLSLYHLSRTFKRETGYSPVQYLNRYRIEQAKTLLSSTRMPIEQVAQSVGIPNGKYFSRLFGQTNGATPRAYRKHTQAIDPRSAHTPDRE